MNNQLRNTGSDEPLILLLLFLFHTFVLSS